MARVKLRAGKGISKPDAISAVWHGGAPVVDVDWQTTSWRVYALLIRAENRGLGILVRPPLDSYWTEPMQESVARTLRVWAAGAVRPTTLEALAQDLARRARHIDDKRREKLRRYQRTIKGCEDEIASVLYGAQAVKLFDAICSRDLLCVFIRDLTDALDEEARALLEAVLVKGVPIGDTQMLADELGTTDLAAVHNTKRRIKYKAGPLLQRLSGEDMEGDSHG